MPTFLATRKSYEHLIACLSDRAREYVALRAQGTPPYAAASAVGYAKPHERAAQMERDPAVRSAIEYTIRVQARERSITKDDVIAGMLDAVHASATASEMVQAWREIGKLVGAYQPQRLEITHRSLTQDKVAELSDEELAELAAIDGEFAVVEGPADIVGSDDD